MDHAGRTFGAYSDCTANSQDLCCLTNLRQLGIETRLPSRELKRTASGTLADGALPAPLPPLGLSVLPNGVCRLSKVHTAAVNSAARVGPPSRSFVCAKPQPPNISTLQSCLYTLRYVFTDASESLLGVSEAQALS